MSVVVTAQAYSCASDLPSGAVSSMRIAPVWTDLGLQAHTAPPAEMITTD